MRALDDLLSIDPEELPAYPKAELEALRRRSRMVLTALDEQEPEDMTSEAYDNWAQQHELLEDLIDDLDDYLDEI